MSDPLVLTTSRLRLTSLDPDALSAWIEGDAAALFDLTGVRFSDPPELPPLLGDDLPMIRDRAAQGPDEAGWWVWLVSSRDDDGAMGVCGLGGRPDEEGTVVIGYSVYPQHERRGIATEAAGALILWALEQTGVRRVLATVPAWNGPSVAVAKKLGMVAIGQGEDPEVGAVDIYEICRA